MHITFRSSSYRIAFAIPFEIYEEWLVFKWSRFGKPREKTSCFDCEEEKKRGRRKREKVLFWNRFCRKVHWHHRLFEYTKKWSLSDRFMFPSSILLNWCRLICDFSIQALWMIDGSSSCFCVNDFSTSLNQILFNFSHTLLFMDWSFFNL